MSGLTPQQKAQRTYNLAADAYDDEALSFMVRVGKETVRLLELKPGMRVLDVCCGTGASALPAAQAVGSSGHVTGVDIAEHLLALARQKARAMGIPQAEFVHADMARLPFPAADFDAVIIVFGIFFIPDMEGQVAQLWRLVKPGGKLIVVSWGARLFEPAYGIWRRTVKQLAPEWAADFNPWDRISTPEALRELLLAAVDPCAVAANAAAPGSSLTANGSAVGRPSIRVLSEETWHRLREPGDFWRIARGLGFRWTIEQMGVQRAGILRERLLQQLADEGVDRIETNVLYGMVKAGRSVSSPAKIASRQAK